MPLRMRLREETAAAHASIERYLGFDARTWTLANYQAYLLFMHAFHRDIEAGLAANRRLQSSGVMVASERKTDWLARDVAWFTLQPLARGPGAPVLASDTARAIGWAYVLEGATLGGRVLYKAIAARWSLDGSRGAAYLWGYGEETSRRWTQFTRALDALDLDEAESGEAVAGANEAFATMEAWFRDNGWHGHAPPASRGPVATV